MTCIVGKVDKKLNRVIIGGDSEESNGSNLFIRKDEKVFTVGDFILGCTTSFRMIQLLRYSFNPPEMGTKDVFEYMCTDFIKEVRKCFQDGGWMQKEPNGSELGGFFLVAYKNRLFKIESDFQVAENINGIDAVGCGADFALGSLITTNSFLIPEERKVLKALEAAEFLSVGVCRPFVIKHT